MMSSVIPLNGPQSAYNKGLSGPPRLNFQGSQSAQLSQSSNATGYTSDPYEADELNNESTIENSPRISLCTRKNWNTSENMSAINAECIFGKGKTIDELPSQEQPVAILKYGPTGSGKGSKKVQEEIESLDVNMEDCVVLEIDALVESLKSYRNKTLKIKQNFNRNSTLNKKNMYKQLTGAYFNSRKKELSEYLNNALKKAAEGARHIVFETTGTPFRGEPTINWFIQILKKAETISGKKYKIVLIYPFVTPGELRKRVQKRATNQASRSVNEKPLFRAVDPNTIEPQTYQAEMNLTHFVLPQLFVKNIDKVVLFWND